MFIKESTAFNSDLEKGKVTDEVAALMGELIFLGEQNGNNLKFKEAGLSGDLNKLLETIKIKPEIAKNLSEKDLELARDTIGSLTSFVMAPMFTDDYGLDHERRQEWEKKVGLRENRANGRVSDKAKKYYHSNSLGFNSCSSAAGLISGLVKYISDPVLKASFQELLKIPPEFLEKDENDNIQHHGLEDAEKVRVVKELKNVAQDVIFFFKA